jgi:hypothetical protein
MEIKYKHSLINPSSLASPCMDRGLNKDIILSPTPWMPLVINDAVPETINGMNAIAKIIIMILHINGFTFDPSSKGLLFFQV